MRYTAVRTPSAGAGVKMSVSCQSRGSRMLTREGVRV